MAEATFVGVLNISGGAKKLTFGGDVVAFAKDEVKVVPADLGHFLLSRVAYGSEDGKRATMTTPFRRVPLHEALKHAKEPENKSIAAAKAEAKREEEIAARVKEQLLKEGWKAPEAPAPKADEKDAKKSRLA